MHTLHVSASKSAFRPSRSTESGNWVLHDGQIPSNSWAERFRRQREGKTMMIVFSFSKQTITAWDHLIKVPRRALGTEEQNADCIHVQYMNLDDSEGWRSKSRSCWSPELFGHDSHLIILSKSGSFPYKKYYRQHQMGQFGRDLENLFTGVSLKLSHAHQSIWTLSKTVPKKPRSKPRSSVPQIPRSSVRVRRFPEVFIPRSFVAPPPEGYWCWCSAEEVLSLSPADLKRITGEAPFRVVPLRKCNRSVLSLSFIMFPFAWPSYHLQRTNIKEVMKWC